MPSHHSEGCARRRSCASSGSHSSARRAIAPLKPDNATTTVYRISGRHNASNPKQAMTNILYVDGHSNSVLRTALPMAPTDFTKVQLGTTHPHPLWRTDQQ